MFRYHGVRLLYDQLIYYVIVHSRGKTEFTFTCIRLSIQIISPFIVGGSSSYHSLFSPIIRGIIPITALPSPPPTFYEPSYNIISAVKVLFLPISPQIYNSDVSVLSTAHIECFSQTVFVK